MMLLYSWEFAVVISRADWMRVASTSSRSAALIHTIAIIKISSLFKASTISRNQPVVLIGLIDRRKSPYEVPHSDVDRSGGRYRDRVRIGRVICRDERFYRSRRVNTENLRPR